MWCVIVDWEGLERKKGKRWCWMMVNNWKHLSDRRIDSFSCRARQKSMFSRKPRFSCSVYPSASFQTSWTDHVTQLTFERQKLRTGHAGRESLRGRLMVKGYLEGRMPKTSGRDELGWERGGTRHTALTSHVCKGPGTFIQRNVCYDKCWNVLWSLTESEDPPHCFNIRPFWNKAEKRELGPALRGKKKEILALKMSSEVFVFSLQQMTVPLWVNAVVSSVNWLERRRDIDPGNRERNSKIKDHLEQNKNTISQSLCTSRDVSRKQRFVQMSLFSFHLLTFPFYFQREKLPTPASLRPRGPGK